MAKARLWVVAGVAVGVLTACGPNGDGGAAPATTGGGTTGTSQSAGGAGAAPSCAPGSGRKFADSQQMNMTDLAGAQLDCAVFVHQSLNSVKLGRAHLSGARFENSSLNQVDFRGAVLRGATFTTSSLNAVDFRDADLTGADLRDANLNATDFGGATCPDGAKSGDSGGCSDHLTPQGAPGATTSRPGGGGGSVQEAPPVLDRTVTGTYHCSDADVAIKGANSDVHLTGSCDAVVVQGDGSHVEVDAAKSIIVNGDNAAVIYHGEAYVQVNGAGATANKR